MTPQKATLDSLCTLSWFVSYRRLSSQFQFSLSAVTLEYLSQCPWPPSLWCCTRIILTVHRETLTQYITFKRGGDGSLYSCNCLATLTSCIDASVRIVTKSPKVQRTSTYILHLSRQVQQQVGYGKILCIADSCSREGGFPVKGGRGSWWKGRIISGLLTERYIYNFHISFLLLDSKSVHTPIL